MERDEVTDTPIEPIKCSVCGKIVAWVNDDGEVDDITHFEVRRSRKEYDIDDGNIEVADENIKMERTICEECFVAILNESPLLGKLFLYKDRNEFIY
jgi:hypothetical protein